MNWPLLRELATVNIIMLQIGLYRVVVIVFWTGYTSTFLTKRTHLQHVKTQCHTSATHVPAEPGAGGRSL